MTPKEFAEMVGCSVSLVKKCIQDRTIEAKKISLPGVGRHVYQIDRSQIAKFKNRPKDTRGWVLGKKRG